MLGELSTIKQAFQRVLQSLNINILINIYTFHTLYFSPSVGLNILTGKLQLSLIIPNSMQ